ncbi:20406_t:CDS:2, partial [Dentiscutata erythropus]
QQTNNSDNNTIEYLPAIDPNSLILKICTTIFLSLDELWTISSDLALTASILDSRFKTFQWAPEQLRYTKKLLEKSYIELKTAINLLNLNNFSNEKSIKTIPQQALDLIELDKVMCYLTLDSIGLNEDPVKW